MAVDGAGNRWPIQAVRAAILVAIALHLVKVSVPVRLYIPHEYVGAPAGWTFALMNVVATLHVVAVWAATALLPLVAYGALTGPPRWARLQAYVLAGAMALVVVSGFALLLPGLVDRIIATGLSDQGPAIWIVTVNALLFLLQSLIGALLVSFVICQPGQPTLACILAGLASLVIPGKALAGSVQSGVPAGKAAR